MEAKSTYDPGAKKNVSSWDVSCSCGWRGESASRDAGRRLYRRHRDGESLVEPEPEAKARPRVIDDKRLDVVATLVSNRGPMRSEEVRGGLFTLGTVVSEATVRKMLRLLVESGRLESKEMPSKRSKVVVLYFAPGTTFEAIAAKVRGFDRVPSGFSVGRSF